MEEIFIRDDMIRLGQFLKLANLVEDGAQAREVIQHGLVSRSTVTLKKRAASSYTPATPSALTA